MGLARPMAPQSAIAPTSDGEYHEQKIPKISLSCASSSADLPECIELATKSPITAAANRCCSALSAITGNCLPRMKIPLPNLITTACSLTQWWARTELKNHLLSESWNQVSSAQIIFLVLIRDWFLFFVLLAWVWWIFVSKSMRKGGRNSTGSY